MLRSAAERLHHYLLQAFPPTQAYPRAVFERPPMPGLIAHFLGRTLDARLESFGRIPPSGWYDVDAPVVQRTLEAWHSALLTTARIPAADWSEALDQAVRLVLVYLVRPAQTLTAFIFGNDEHHVAGELVLARMQYFDAYPYLHAGVERYLSDEGLSEVNRTPFLNLITRLDRAHTVGFEAEDWMALLQPIFDLMRIAPPAEQPGIPVDVLQLFFEQKGETETLRRLEDLKAGQNVVALDEEALRRVLQSPPVSLTPPPDVPTLPAPPAAPDAAPPRPADRPAPTSEPLDEETETPLWMKFRRAKAAADRERKGITILRRSQTADDSIADDPGPADPRTVKPEDIVEPIEDSIEEPIVEVAAEPVDEPVEFREPAYEPSAEETAEPEGAVEPVFEPAETAVSETWAPGSEDEPEDEPELWEESTEAEAYDAEAIPELEAMEPTDELAVEMPPPDEPEPEAAPDALEAEEAPEMSEAELAYEEEFAYEEEPPYEEASAPPMYAEDEAPARLEEVGGPPADEASEQVDMVGEAASAFESETVEEPVGEEAVAPEEAEPRQDTAYDEVQAWLAAGSEPQPEPVQADAGFEPEPEPEIVSDSAPEAVSEPGAVVEPQQEDAREPVPAEPAGPVIDDEPDAVLYKTEARQDAAASPEVEEDSVVVTDDETLLPVEAFPIGKRAPLPDDPDPEEAEEPSDDAPVPLWQRLQRQLGSGPTLATQAVQGKRAQVAGAAPKIPAAPGGLTVDEEQDMQRLERALLGRVDDQRRAMFVDHLFGGSRPDYLDVLEALGRCTSWPEASRVIAGRVFRKHNVNIYSEPAIEFTDVLEAHFRRGRSRE